MPILVACEHCSKKLTIPDNLVNKNVRCPECQGIFNAKKGRQQFDITDNEEEQEEVPGNVQTKYCYECGKVIRAKAEICPKCGVRQPDMSYEKVPKKQHSKAHNIIVTSILISGICNLVYGLVCISTLIGAIVGAPLCVLSFFEFKLWADSDSISKEDLYNRAYTISIFERLSGLCLNFASLACGVIVGFNINAIKPENKY